MRKTLRLSIAFLGSILLTHGAAIEHPAVFEAGFELETSGIKIQHDDQNTILVILQSTDGKWQLTSDTHDTQIDGTNWVNLECRTVKGLTQTELTTAANTTFKLMCEIKAICDMSEDGRWTLDFIKACSFWGTFLKWKLPYDKTITFSTKKKPVDSNTAWTSLPFDLRPQLSFSFPMGRMRDVLRRVLKAAAHDGVHPPCLTAETENEKDPWKNMKTLEEVLAKDGFIMGQKMGPYRAKAHNLFVQTRAIATCETEPLTEANGLLLLFCSHVYDLFFQNIAKSAIQETGPKPFVKVVSRLPFSEMFQQLSSTEQGKFKDLFAQVFAQYPELRVKPYRRDAPTDCYEKDNASTPAQDMIAESERITLMKWFDSIVTPHLRATGIARDLLSPPPHTATDYAMGAISASELPEGHALIEARGYSGSISREESYNIQLDKFVKLIKSESERFFQLGHQGE